MQKAEHLCDRCLESPPKQEEIEELLKRP